MPRKKTQDFIPGISPTRYLRYPAAVFRDINLVGHSLVSETINLFFLRCLAIALPLSIVPSRACEKKAEEYRSQTAYARKRHL